jgi:hypothetical protein
MSTEQQKAWDEYWTKKLEDDFWRRFALIGMRPDALLEHFEFFQLRNVHRILLPGNGCSLLPHVLVHLGFDVTIVDISPVACETVMKYEQKMKIPQLLAPFLTVRRKVKEKWGGSHVTVMEADEEATLLRVEQEARPDGKLTIETADLLDWEPAEPFDLIYDDRCMQVLGSDDWPEVARRYFRWLQPTGFCILETINLGGTMGEDVSPTRDPFEAAFQDAGFSQFRLYRSCPEPPLERFVNIIYGSG